MAQLTAFKRVVANMMARFGTTATVLVTSAGTYNPATSENVVTEEEYEVEAIFLDLTLQSNGLQSVPNTLIEAGDKQVFIQPTEELPSIKPNKDKIIIGSTTYKIVTMKQVNPTMADCVLYELYVRE